MHCWFSVVFFFFSSFLEHRFDIPPAVSFLLPALSLSFVAARGKCVDGAAQRGRLNSLSRGGGAGEWWRLASFAAGYQQSGGSRGPPQSSAVFRPGALPGECVCPRCCKSLWMNCTAAMKSVMHLFRPVWRWMGSFETPSWRPWALGVWKGLMGKSSTASVAVYRSVPSAEPAYISMCAHV